MAHSKLKAIYPLKFNEIKIENSDDGLISAKFLLDNEHVYTMNSNTHIDFYNGDTLNILGIKGEIEVEIKER